MQTTLAAPAPLGCSGLVSECRAVEARGRARLLTCGDACTRAATGLCTHGAGRVWVSGTSTLGLFYMPNPGKCTRWDPSGIPTRLLK